MERAGGVGAMRDRVQIVKFRKRAGILMAPNAPRGLTALNVQTVQNGLRGPNGRKGQTGILRNPEAGSSSLIRPRATLTKDPGLKIRKSQIRIKSVLKIIAKRTEYAAREAGLTKLAQTVLGRRQAKSQDRIQNLSRFAQKPNPMKGVQIRRNIKNQAREAHRALIAMIIPGQMVAASFV
jgi:hypothetical protein